MIFLNNLLGGGGGSGAASGGGGTGTSTEGGNYSSFDYVNGGLSVELPQTEYIHGDTFNTSGAVVIYTSPAGETTDVTSAATFDPSNGSTLNQDGQNTVRVSYAASGKDEVYASQIINVAAVPESLTVVLHDDGMRVGESVSYKGAKVTATMSDRSQKDVSGATLVWSPIEGTVKDSNGNFTVTCSYTENGVTASGTVEMNVVEHTLASIRLVLGKTEYFYGDDFTTTNTVVTATYDDGATANVASKCDFLPESGSELTEHGVVPVTCTYTENSVSKTANSKVTVKPKPTELTVSFSDSGFKVGDTLDYSRATVTCKYSDNSTANVTDQVTWSPSAGTALTDNGSQNVTATYTSGDISLSGEATISVTDLKVTALGGSIAKTAYREGDSLDTSGAQFTAMYENGTTKDVTNSVNYNPSEGSTLKKDNTKVTVSYSENGDTVSCDISISVAYVTGLSVSGLRDKSYKEGDPLDLTGVTVTATYSDGSSEDVTDEVDWNLSDGTELNQSNTTLTASYNDGNTTVKENTPLNVASVTSITFTGISTTYNAGDELDLSGASVTAEYSDGTSKNVTNEASFEPSDGSTLDYNDKKVTASYGGKTSSISITVNDVVTGIQLTLAKDDYKVGDSFNVSDASVMATYASGSQRELSNTDSHISWKPANGTQLNKEGQYVVVVTYTV